MAGFKILVSWMGFWFPICGNGVLVAVLLVIWLLLGSFVSIHFYIVRFLIKLYFAGSCRVQVIVAYC